MSWSDTDPLTEINSQITALRAVQRAHELDLIAAENEVVAAMARHDVNATAHAELEVACSHGAIEDYDTEINILLEERKSYVDDTTAQSATAT